MRSWHPEDLDWDFMRAVRSQLSPDWFWDADKVPFLLERISGELRKRLRAPGDSLLVPGLGTVSVIMFRHGGSEWPVLHVAHELDWPFSVQGGPVGPWRPLFAPRTQTKEETKDDPQEAADAGRPGQRAAGPGAACEVEAERGVGEPSEQGLQARMQGDKREEDEKMGVSDRDWDWNYVRAVQDRLRARGSFRSMETVAEDLAAAFVELKGRLIMPGDEVSVPFFGTLRVVRGSGGFDVAFDAEPSWAFMDSMKDVGEEKA